MISPTWIIQQIIPPALLTYFGWTAYLCVTEIGPKYIGSKLGHPLVGAVYVACAITGIPSVSILFTRLYFLPRNQSVPPRDPTSQIRMHAIVFECLSPAEARAVRDANDDHAGNEVNAPLVNRCWRGRCGGRWKPARARHCSECGTCRAGFDHHCAFFANCLTAPHIPAFLCLLCLTPPIILLLSSPLYYPLAVRAVRAHSLAWSDAAIRSWWYDWTPSWIIAGGPVGRYFGGIILGWKTLDRWDGGGTMRLEIGILVGIGVVLCLITTGLAAATTSLVRNGHLTVDRERRRSQARAQAAVNDLRRKGKEVPPEALATLERWSDKHFFWVPGEGGQEAGHIVELRDGWRAYDHGRKANWEMVMGKGWGWLLPWRALRLGMCYDAILHWPINPIVVEELKGLARRQPER